MPGGGLAPGLVVPLRDVAAPAQVPVRCQCPTARRDGSGTDSSTESGGGGPNPSSPAAGDRRGRHGRSRICRERGRSQVTIAVRRIHGNRRTSTTTMAPRTRPPVRIHRGTRKMQRTSAAARPRTRGGRGVSRTRPAASASWVWKSVSLGMVFAPPRGTCWTTWSTGRHHPINLRPMPVIASLSGRRASAFSRRRTPSA